MLFAATVTTIVYRRPSLRCCHAPQLRTRAFQTTLRLTNSLTVSRQQYHAAGIPEAQRWCCREEEGPRRCQSSAEPVEREVARGTTFLSNGTQHQRLRDQTCRRGILIPRTQDSRETEGTFTDASRRGVFHLLRGEATRLPRKHA